MEAISKQGYTSTLMFFVGVFVHQTVEVILHVFLLLSLCAWHDKVIKFERLAAVARSEGFPISLQMMSVPDSVNG